MLGGAWRSRRRTRWRCATPGCRRSRTATGGSRMPPPTTCDTAIASPTARPRPRNVAAATPAAVEGSTTPRTISQRVAPSASAPSFTSRGTLRKRSRLSEAMIGTTMIVRIRLAVKMLAPVVWGGPKIGRKPRWSWSQGSRCAWTNGARMRMPQNPRITLGIAASSSTIGPRTALMPRGRQQAEIEPDRDADRRREQQRHGGADRGAVEQRARAELVEVGRPARIAQEPEPELARSTPSPRRPPCRRSAGGQRLPAGRPARRCRRAGRRRLRQRKQRAASEAGFANVPQRWRQGSSSAGTLKADPRLPKRFTRFSRPANTMDTEVEPLGSDAARQCGEHC